MVRVAGRVMVAGDCAGLFIVPPGSVLLRVGQQIDVHMMELTPVFTLPRSSDPAVLRQTGAGQDGIAGTFSALRPGRAVLVSHAWCVGLKLAHEIKGSCPVLDVTVVPG
jgi:hypothetical protein